METSHKKEGWVRSIEVMMSNEEYPMDRDTAEFKIGSLTIDGTPIAQYFDKVKWPIKSRDDLINQIRQAKANP